MSFDEAWSTRVPTEIDDVAVDVLGRDALVRSKRASGRPKDRHDLAELERLRDAAGGR